MSARVIAPNRELLRLRLALRGAVQGVGFRPFVFRLARKSGLTGWVNNSAQGVFIEAEGQRTALEQFLLHLETGKPPRSFIQSLEASWLDPVGYADFEIRESGTAGGKTALILPDLATCPDCRREIFDPSDRRYRYPFTNCTNCGPRFSIIESLPYDRTNTSMKGFTMCPACQAEYDDPTDRRFHAQPNACPICGPHLELWDAAGGRLSESDDALRAAAAAIRQGEIVAVKGLGGFHLLVDARNDAAVRRLRDRKHREEKPLALMFPTLADVTAVCEVSRLEERLLGSPESPVVLLKQIANHESPIANSVAPGNPNLGVMLPYTPLHHLLLAELGFPVVATSGNLSDEPICTDEHEALDRLGNIAGVFLVHDRPIVRHVDDSIVRVMLDREQVLRRARGYAPLPVTLNSQLSTLNSQPILAVGAHLKNTVALALGDQVFISQHIGDLETEPAYEAFQRVVNDFQRLYAAQPAMIAGDLHPDYLSTKFAQSLAQACRPEDSGGNPATNSTAGRGRSVNSRVESQRYLGVQHHIAHVLSGMAENDLQPPVLGVSWDGTGFGLDGRIWGGEFFLVLENEIHRVAHLRPFPLPGGEAAVKEPRRAALGLLHELSGADDNLLLQVQQKVAARFPAAELAVINGMLARGLNSPVCTSMGRLFDAVASLVNLRQRTHFEGQAAMELEFAMDGVKTDEAYPLPITGNGSPASSRLTSHVPNIVDWSLMIEAILTDLKRGVPVGEISARFHNGLAEAVVAVARQTGQSRVVLSGGCFQNRYLTERTVTRLRAEGFGAYWHQRVPPNDGGISLGQIVAARRANR